jgi:hypothetical protein
VQSTRAAGAENPPFAVYYLDQRRLVYGRFAFRVRVKKKHFVQKNGCSTQAQIRSLFAQLAREGSQTGVQRAALIF